MELNATQDVILGDEVHLSNIIYNLVDNANKYTSRTSEILITSKEIVSLIRDFRNAGKTVIFSTHIMSEVSLLSDQLAIIHKGKLLYNDSFEYFTKNMKSRSLEDEFIRLVEEA